MANAENRVNAQARGDRAHDQESDQNAAANGHAERHRSRDGFVPGGRY
jgi:hypothetical protein